ncbi:Histone-lysine N-methyltransferase SUVR4 [Linum grandiflorum]
MVKPHYCGPQIQFASVVDEDHKKVYSEQKGHIKRTRKPQNSTHKQTVQYEATKHFVHQHQHGPQGRAHRLLLSSIIREDCYSSRVGDYLASELPCKCAAETGGEFAYNAEELLKVEFLEKLVVMNKLHQKKHYYYCNELRKKRRKLKACKGYLSRKFIKECRVKCCCSKRCGNRVIQSGIRDPLQVFATSAEKERGVRSATTSKKRTFICEYISKIVKNQELYKRNMERVTKNEVHTYPMLLDADWGSETNLKDEEALCWDAIEFGNVGRFINHRCEDANLIDVADYDRCSERDANFDGC